MDELLVYLLDEEWKRQCMADWDRLHEDPEAWQSYLDESRELEGLDEPVNEPPYQSDDPKWLAAGGTPLTVKEVA